MLKTISNLIYPPRCKGCGIFVESMENGIICDSCFSKLIFLEKPRCPICGLMFLKSGGQCHECVSCKVTMPFFSKARSLVRYSEEIGHLIHKFKFGGDLSILEIFSKLDKSYFPQDLGEVDCILPVPLHSKRIQERGFNQAALLAKVFFPLVKHKIKHFLIRSHNTKPQTKLDGEMRRKNLKNCFKLLPNIDVRNKVIYIVDDVYTTGTTVNECAKVLMKAGARRVEVFTLAMVVKENEV